MSLLDVSPLHQWRGNGSCNVHLCPGPLRLVPLLLHHALASAQIVLGRDLDAGNQQSVIDQALSAD